MKEMYLDDLESVEQEVANLYLQQAGYEIYLGN